MSDVINFSIFMGLLVGFAGFMTFLVWRQERRDKAHKKNP